MIDYEVGYTPTNLRLILTKLGMTQNELASFFDVNERTVSRWLNKDLEFKRHCDMPLVFWLELLKLLPA